MKYWLRILFAIIFVASSFTFVMASSLDRGKDIIVDPFCSQHRSLLPDNASADCNFTCPRECLYFADEYTKYTEKYCQYRDDNADPYVCLDGPLSGATDPIRGELDFFNLRIAYDDAFNVFFRLFLMLALSLVGLGSIAFVAYGVYVRSTSLAEPEKVEAASKIIRNAVTGTIIAFVSIGALQIFSVIFGVTSSFFDFSLIPRSGIRVVLTKEDLGRACNPEQKASGSGEYYVCDPQDFIWVEGGSGKPP